MDWTGFTNGLHGLRQLVLRSWLGFVSAPEAPANQLQADSNTSVISISLHVSPILCASNLSSLNVLAQRVRATSFYTPPE